uniref:Leucine-rich repeat neuronal protein 1 n=1 Tax=Ascaris suum TaxID=6253 RepID=F1KWR4_ASCSU
MLAMSPIMVLFVFVAAMIFPAFSTWNYTRCPSQCSCFSSSNMLTVDCSLRNLIRFPDPETIPADVQVINASWNKIFEIPSDFKFWFPDARVLDISFNELMRIPLLEGLDRLQILDLSGNRLSSLPDDSFASMIYLESLLLLNNGISNISENAFRGLGNLRQLHLGWNSLTDFPSFQFTPKLVELSLEHNYLSAVANGSVQLSLLHRLRLQHNTFVRLDSAALLECTQLQSLHLSHNRFATVPQLALRSVATTLTTVDLSGNPIKTVRSGDFIAMSEMREINLSDCNITVIEDGAFEDLPNLLRLRLNDNPTLSFIDDDAFTALPAISTLYLHNGNITSVFNFLAAMPSLQTLTLYGNSMLCDCNIRWLQIALSKGIVTEPNRIFCRHMNTTYHQLLKDAEFAPECSPRIVYIPEHVNARESQQLVLRCYANGIPKPSVRWLNSNGEIVSQSRTLVIEEVRQSDSSEFVCVVDSKHGTAFRGVRLNFSPQLYLQITSLQPTSVLLKLSANYNQTLQISLTNSESTLAFTVSSGSRFYLISNLRPLSVYDACLLIESCIISCVSFTTPDSIFTQKLPNHWLLTGVLIMLVVVSLVSLHVLLKQIKFSTSSVPYELYP